MRRSALSESDAEHILRLVRGSSDDGRDAAILNAAAISVRRIKRATATAPAAQRQQAYKRATKKIAAAIKSIESLPEAAQFDLEAFQRAHDRIIALASEITVRRSGGKQRGPGGGRIEAAQKRAAADCAGDMVLEFGGTPTLSRRGFYYRLTLLLFKIATGNAGSVEDACKRARDRWISSAELKRVRREGRQSKAPLWLTERLRLDALQRKK